MQHELLVWFCGHSGTERKAKYWIPDRVRNDRAKLNETQVTAQILGVGACFTEPISPTKHLVASQPRQTSCLRHPQIHSTGGFFGRTGRPAGPRSKQDVSSREKRAKPGSSFGVKGLSAVGGVSPCGRDLKGCGRRAPFGLGRVT